VNAQNTFLSSQTLSRPLELSVHDFSIGAVRGKLGFARRVGIWEESFVSLIVKSTIVAELWLGLQRCAEIP